MLTLVVYFLAGLGFWWVIGSEELTDKWWKIPVTVFGWPVMIIWSIIIWYGDDLRTKRYHKMTGDDE